MEGSTSVEYVGLESGRVELILGDLEDVVGEEKTEQISSSRADVMERKRT